ncbi:prolyl oligopeptidase family serine peptidase [Mycolicibacterium aubagnense]
MVLRAHLSRLTAAFAAGLMVVAAPMPAASAAAPNWSGLDTRAFAAPVPQPGTLITTVPLDPVLSVAAAARAYRILYSTTDQHNSPAVSTAVVFIPKGPAPQGGWPVLAWAHGTVGLGDDCTPSAQPRSQRDNEYLSHWLEQGYVVVGSDYTGLGTPGLMSYLNSVATAHAIIDSVIAAHHLDLPLSPMWALVGQSQGGAAAVASARWATEFSRGTGLDYRGVVATGTPANIDDVVITAGPDMVLPPGLGPIASAYAAYILAGFREARPDLAVNSVLTPAGLAAADKAETLCTAPLSASLDGLTPQQFFAAPLASLPGMRGALADFMGTPVAGYDRPIFLGVGLKDRDVPPSSTLKFAGQLKANGQDVALHVYPEDDHSSAVLTSMADSTPFLQAQFAG